jgi:hypothetical protein
MASEGEISTTISQLASNDADQGALLSYREFTYSGFTRNVNIQVVCDRSVTSVNESSLIFISEIDHGNNLDYYFRISTNLGCPVRTPMISFMSYVGIGGLLVTLCAVVLFTYFMLGMIINKCYYDKSGREIIPHYAFWSDIPKLIRDGGLLIGDGVKKLIRRRRPESATTELVIAPIQVIKRRHDIVNSPASPP